MKQTLRLIALLMVAAAAAACQRGETLMNELRRVDHDAWDNVDTLIFDLPPVPHSGRYIVALTVRTAVSTPYPYDALPLRLEQQWYAPDTLAHRRYVDGAALDSAALHRNDSILANDALHRDVVRFAQWLGLTTDAAHERGALQHRRVAIHTLRLATPEGAPSGSGVAYHQYHQPVDTLYLTPGLTARFLISHALPSGIARGVTDVGVEVVEE